IPDDTVVTATAESPPETTGSAPTGTTPLDEASSVAGAAATSPVLMDWVVSNIPAGSSSAISQRDTSSMTGAAAGTAQWSPKAAE
ncbi:MAG: hypothetical protein ACKOHK_05515, partial [Planctomycetia bacterium]